MADPATYSRRPLTNGLLLCALVSLLAAGTSCLSRRTEERGDTRDGCAACHGDAKRQGDALTRSAPPRDLLGAGDTSYPGVGAHQIHLQRSATHGGVACNECHVVPKTTDSPGHADDPAPAEVVFGEIASSGGLRPEYDPVARRCDDSYCHGGSAEAIWTEPRDSKAACGTCHGLPPPEPHPQSSLCSTCHGAVIDASMKFTAPELHVNGRVELRGQSCTQCHGSGEEPAPPVDTRGSVSTTAIGVGAHAVHLSGGLASRPVACGECHAVPEEPEDFAHADGLPAEVELMGPAATGDSEPVWARSSASCQDSWCHGPNAPRGSVSPSWTSAGTLGCSDCHGYPPPSPHPQIETCSTCHGDVIGSDDETIVTRQRHVDGVVDVMFDRSCTACHGGDDPAPPRALNGDTATSSPGVGAHRAHLSGSERSRAVPCSECHRVPEDVLEPGHMDSYGPAEVLFSGAATAFGAMPSYAEGRCSNTSCHGGRFPGGHASGGSLVNPSWTTVDGSQAACGTCHGLPPPRPHPYHSQDCGRCHENMSPDGTTFLRPDLHVDGVVTFTF